MSMAEARPRSKIGINKMIVTTPGITLSPMALAESITHDQMAAKGKEYHRARDAVRKEHSMIQEWEIDEHVKPAMESETEGKIRKGLGVDLIRMPGYSESNVTFVANMLYEFMKKLADDKESMGRISQTPIRTIYYGTESNPDRSRPEIEPALLLAGSKLLAENEAKYRPIMEMMRSAAVVPVTFACVGGVLSLNEAVSRVRYSAENGHRESALVVTADTALYNSKSAPGAEPTQGAAGALMWVTNMPNLVEIFDRWAGYHLPLSDFTKFQEETPVVHGKFSEIVYVYTVGKALQRLEEEYSSLGNGNSKILEEIDFFICHVPFPKQAIYLASFLFAHHMKNKNPALFAAMQSRPEVGPDPLIGYAKLTELIEARFREFNTNGHGVQHEHAVIAYIENEPMIKAYWDWLKRVRETPEFEKFVEGLHIKEALKLPSLVGNSYTTSVTMSLASLVVNGFGRKTWHANNLGVLAGYGSGAQAMVFPIRIVARPDLIADHLSVDIDVDGKYQLDAAGYRELHGVHLHGDSARMLTGEDLVEKDKKLLRSETLPKGFHVVRRNPNGTGEYVYSDGMHIEPVKIRF